MIPDKTTLEPGGGKSDRSKDLLSSRVSNSAWILCTYLFRSAKVSAVDSLGSSALFLESGGAMYVYETFLRGRKIVPVNVVFTALFGHVIRDFCSVYAEV